MLKKLFKRQVMCVTYIPAVPSVLCNATFSSCSIAVFVLDDSLTHTEVFIPSSTSDTCKSTTVAAVEKQSVYGTNDIENRFN